MKFLITGANGQLGRELATQLKAKKADLILTGAEDLDITDSIKVYEFINNVKPNVIINCAAHTSVDKCEIDKDNAFKINAIGPKNLAQAAFNVGSEIVQISTDYIFDGEDDKPIIEFDKPNPQTVYGRTKLYGEELVRSLNTKHYIVRTAWLYGDGDNFVKTMINQSKTNNTLKVVNDQYGTPTSTVDLARVVIKVIEEKNYGTFHATCKGQCTWYDFTKEIFRLCNIKTEVIPCTTEEYPRLAKRPKYSVLRNYMLEMTTGDITRDWEEALKEYIRRNC